MLSRRALAVLQANWSDLALVIATATCVGMTVALTVPLLTLSLERIGASPLTIGLNAAAGGVGIFLIGPFIGRLAAGLGPVRCFQLGLLVCAACLLLFLARVEPWYWAAIRLVFGCAAALIFVINEAAINGLAPSSGRGRVLGAYATLFTVGYAGGPLILLLAGTEGARPFLLAAGLFLLALVPTIAMRRIEDRLRPHQSGERHGLLSIASAAPLPLATVLVYAFIEGASFALMPVWALDRGLSPEGAAALVGIWLSGNILLQIPLGWLADHMPRARVIAGCALLSAAGLLLLPCVAVEPERVWLLLVPLGGLMGGLYTLGLTLLGDRFQGASLTTANTAFVMTFQIGMITGPPIVGAAMQGMGAEVFPLALLPPLCILACVAALPSRRAPVEGRPTE